MDPHRIKQLVKKYRVQKVKQSGFGREMGPHALEAYTQVKSVWVSLD